MSRLFSMIFLILFAVTLTACGGSLLDRSRLESNYSQHFAGCEFVEAEKRVGFLCDDRILTVQSFSVSTSHAEAVDSSIKRLRKNLGILSDTVQTSDKLVIEARGELIPLTISVVASDLGSTDDAPVGGYISTSHERTGDRRFCGCYFDIPPNSNTEVAIQSNIAWCKRSLTALIESVDD